MKNRNLRVIPLCLLICAVTLLALSSCTPSSPDPTPAATPSLSPSVADVSTAPSTDNTAFSSSAAISDLKGSALGFYPAKNLGQAFDNFMVDAEWSAFTDDTDTYVTVSGGILYNDMLATAVVTYKHEGDSFNIYSFDIDGAAKDYELYADLIIAVFEDDLISIVKDGVIYGYNEPFGEALMSLYDELEWEAFMYDDGNIYVRIDCYYEYEGEDFHDILVFLIDAVNEEFGFDTYLEDGDEMTLDDFMELVELLYS